MKSWKEITIALTTGILIGSVITVSAGTWTSAYRNDEISVTLNGEKQTFLDEKTGELMLPLTYNDRTYLPLRNVANVAGLKVDYDEKTKTAILETKDYVRPEVTQPTMSIKNDFDFFNMMKKEKNYMVSPFSLRMAMMMAANGAEGKTKSEILKGLNVANLEEYNTLAEKLIAKYQDNKAVKLNVANSIWLNRTMAGDVQFSKNYQYLIAKYYDGTSQVEDKGAIVSKVNQWVSNKTNGKIKDLLEKDDFLSVLVNTIYFKGEWAEQFEKRATYPEEFTDQNGKKTTTDFMHTTDRYDYYEDKTMQMIKIPYKGYNTAMYVILPKADASQMDIETAMKKMDYAKVHLSLPKFKTEYDLSFKKILQSLGIQEAFDEEHAQFKNVMFTGVAPEVNVYISDVIQKTFIDVDENGTEAAAATAVIVDVTSALPIEEEIKEFKADKPFMYFIMDEESKQVLFMGEQLFAE